MAALVAALPRDIIDLLIFILIYGRVAEMICFCARIQWFVDSFDIRAFNACGVVTRYISVGIKVSKWRCVVVRFVKLFFE